MFFKRLYCLLFGCQYILNYIYMIKICNVCNRCHIGDNYLNKIRESLYYYPDIFLSDVLIYSISNNYEDIEALVPKDYVKFKILDKRFKYDVNYSKYLQLGGKGRPVKEAENYCIVIEPILLPVVEKYDQFVWRNIIMALQYGVLLSIDTTSIEGHTLLIIR